MKNVVMAGLIALLAASTAWGQRELLLWTKTTDDQLAEKLNGFTILKTLYLFKTKITDAGLGHLKGLTKLKVRGLSFTKITDAGLIHLKGLTNLKTLYLFSTKVTDAGPVIGCQPD